VKGTHGMIKKEDIDMIAGELENNSTAALMLFENLWALKFKEAVMRADGKLLNQARISHEDVEEALAKFASAEQPV
jgi:hypothetical protein